LQADQRHSVGSDFPYVYTCPFHRTVLNPGDRVYVVLPLAPSKSSNLTGIFAHHMRAKRQLDIASAADPFFKMPSHCERRSHEAGRESHEAGRQSDSRSLSRRLRGGMVAAVSHSLCRSRNRSVTRESGGVADAVGEKVATARVLNRLGRGWGSQRQRATNERWSTLPKPTESTIGTDDEHNDESDRMSVLSEACQDPCTASITTALRTEGPGPESAKDP